MTTQPVQSKKLSAVCALSSGHHTRRGASVSIFPAGSDEAMGSFQIVKWD